MKKIITLIFVLTSFSIFSQSKFVAGASFNVGFPTGSFANDAETGIGGSLIGEYFFSEEYSVLFSVSYQNYPGNFEDIAVQGKILDISVSSIPVVVGGRYYIEEGVFTTIELGSYFFRVNVEASDIYTDEKYSSEYEAKFGGGFGLGYRFNLSEQSVMEFDGVYQIVEDNLNSVSLRLGILILLDKI
jgi:hypothetical protein